MEEQDKLKWTGAERAENMWALRIVELKGRALAKQALGATYEKFKLLSSDSEKSSKNLSGTYPVGSGADKGMSTPMFHIVSA